MTTTDPPGRATRDEAAAGRGCPASGSVALALAVAALSALVLVPVDGEMPSPDLDESWPYTLADAVARRLAFGRDVVFTFGPLSSLYTRFFLPDQRLAVAAATAVLVSAFCLSAVAVSRRGERLRGGRAASAARRRRPFPPRPPDPRRLHGPGRRARRAGHAPRRAGRAGGLRGGGGDRAVSRAPAARGPFIMNGSPPDPPRRHQTM